MSNQIRVQQDLIPFDEVERMAKAVAASGLFGMKNPAQAIALMLFAQAEGLHPMIAVRDYHIMNGRPAMKAEVMLARFQADGGIVEWEEYSDTRAAARFSHPQSPKPVLIEWTIERAGKIIQETWEGHGDNAKKVKRPLIDKDVWKFYPRAMLRSRVISEGVRTVRPGVLSGLYTPEEIRDLSEVHGPAETTGPDIQAAKSTIPAYDLEAAKFVAGSIMDKIELRKWLATERQRMGWSARDQGYESLKAICAERAARIDEAAAPTEPMMSDGVD